MQIITADLSSDNVFPNGDIIGSEGIFNASTLKIILSEGLLSPEITYYRMLFKNGFGEVYYSEKLYASQGEISCILWDRLLVAKRLSVQVEAYGIEESETVILDKSRVLTFTLDRSIEAGVNGENENKYLLNAIHVLDKRIGEVETALSNYTKTKTVALAVTPTDNGDDTCTVDLSNLGSQSEIRCKTSIDSDCSFNLPAPETDGVSGEYFEKEILLYAEFTDEVSIDWGEDILFYGNAIPDVSEGYYEIIFTFDANAEKWCVGVISKGDGE